MYLFIQKICVCGVFFLFLSHALYNIGSFCWIIFKYDLLEGNVLSPWVGNMLNLSQQQSVLLIGKQVLMAFTGNLIHQDLAKKLIEKMMVGGGEGWWTVFRETWNNNSNNKKIMHCLFLKVLSVWQTGLEKRISNCLIVACPGNSNALCHHCLFHKRMKSPARDRW